MNCRRIIRFGSSMVILHEGRQTKFLLLVATGPAIRCMYASRTGNVSQEILLLGS